MPDSDVEPEPAPAPMATAAQASVTLPPFKKCKDTADCLVAFDKYVKRARLGFNILKLGNDPNNGDQLVRRSYLEMWGGEDMEDLITNTADPPPEDNTSFDDMVKAIQKGLGKRINQCYPMYRFFKNMPKAENPSLIGCTRS